VALSHQEPECQEVVQLVAVTWTVDAKHMTAILISRRIRAQIIGRIAEEMTDRHSEKGIHIHLLTTMSRFATMIAVGEPASNVTRIEIETENETEDVCESWITCRSHRQRVDRMTGTEIDGRGVGVR